eukprot:CFRG3807T1
MKVFSTILAAVLVAAHADAVSVPNEHKNLIIAITDGMGPTYVALSRAAKGHLAGEDVSNAYSDVSLSFEENLIGQHRSRSYDNYVTDSAAGAVAFAAGHRVKNNWVNVLPDNTNVGTVFGAAKYQHGYHIGIVAKSTVTHATPASFYSNSRNRNHQNRIADQALLFQPDVILGGGLKHFQDRPASYYNKSDAIVPKADLIPDFEDLGYSVVYNTSGLDALDASEGKRVLGLFAPSGVTYAIDGYLNGTQPNLTAMTQFAMETLEAMSAKSGKPYLIMVEASEIDWAGHSNDPASIVREVLEYEDTWQYLQDFADKNNNTALIGTSDHETGGISVGGLWIDNPTMYSMGYWYQPDALLAQTRSFDDIASEVHKHEWNSFPPSYNETVEYALGFVERDLHVNVSTVTDEEKDCLYKGFYTEDANAWRGGNITTGLNCVMGRRANVKFTSTGHTGTDINIYAHPPLDPFYNGLRGVIDNFQIGKWIAEKWDLDLELDSARVNATAYGPEYPMKDI